MAALGGLFCARVGVDTTTPGGGLCMQFSSEMKVVSSEEELTVICGRNRRLCPRLPWALGGNSGSPRWPLLRADVTAPKLFWIPSHLC